MCRPRVVKRGNPLVAENLLGELVLVSVLLPPTHLDLLRFLGLEPRAVELGAGLVSPEAVEELPDVDAPEGVAHYHRHLLDLFVRREVVWDEHAGDLVVVVVAAAAVPRFAFLGLAAGPRRVGSVGSASARGPRRFKDAGAALPFEARADGGGVGRHSVDAHGAYEVARGRALVGPTVVGESRRRLGLVRVRLQPEGGGGEEEGGEGR
mmetsp:Transcript_19026/g.39148  ORF Transcript_19026/g.39148 Transcript_19026/m.39148 type:complete len:208 (+) Transcript_19026:609-1232(+)